MMKFLLTLKKEAEFAKTNHISNININNYPGLTLSNIRKRFEEFLEFWGLDFNRSSKLWDIYCEFEIENLKLFSKIQDEVNFNQTKNIIRGIYRRRLSFPHLDLDIVWNEYRAWEDEEEQIERVKVKYEEASKKVEEMMGIEEKFNDFLDKAKTENDSSQLISFLQNEIVVNFKTYPNYVRLFFERALEINPDDDDIWLVYLDFHREKVKDKNMILLFLKRATKCCYFNYVFWVLLIRQMESLGSPYEEIQTVISRAYNSAEERNFISEIWKATLEYSLRNFDYTVEQLQSIRQTFSAAINDIQNKGNSLYIIKILNIWADFEVYKAKDEIQMNELMNRVVKLEPSAESWKAFLNYTKVFGNVESIRKVYKRALSFCKEEKNLFAEAWVMWEKIYGTVESVEYALEYSKSQKGKKSSKPSKKQLNDNELTEENKTDKKTTTVKKEKRIKLGKRKINSNITKEKENEVSMKTEEKILNESKRTVFIKGLSPLSNEESIKSFILPLLPSANIQDIRIVRDRKGISKGISFVDFSDAATANRCALLINNKVIDGNKVACAVSKPPKFGENDNRTLFVNNISFASTEDSIKAAFENYGQILDVRIISDKLTNKPKGYCYVEFLEEESIAKVMEHRYNFVVDNRKLMIKSSQSVTKLRENVKYVAHVTNLPFVLSEEKLKKFFTSNGVEGITDCLISKDDEGNSKGFGFVEFNSQDFLDKALSLSGIIIKGRPITVKISTRNITRNNKRKASNDLESIIAVKKLRRTEDENSSVESKNKLMSNQDFMKFLK